MHTPLWERNTEGPKNKNKSGTLGARYAQKRRPDTAIPHDASGIDKEVLCWTSKDTKKASRRVSKVVYCEGEVALRPKMLELTLRTAAKLSSAEPQGVESKVLARPLATFMPSRAMDASS